MRETRHSWTILQNINYWMMKCADMYKQMQFGTYQFDKIGVLGRTKNSPTVTFLFCVSFSSEKKSESIERKWKTQKPSLKKNFFVLTISFCRLDSFQYYLTFLEMKEWELRKVLMLFSTCYNYSLVRISSDEVFFKILKKTFIVQK